MTAGNLAIQDNDTVIQYSAVGESQFTFPFPILEASELKVSRNQILLTYGTDYSITGFGDDGGGYITLLLGASTPGDIWTLWQDMPIERLTGFSAGAATILGAALNAEFAARLRVEQQLRREIRNSVRLPPDDPASGQDMVLPFKTTRAGKYLAFDAAGLPVAAAGTGNDAALRADLANMLANGNTLIAILRTAAELARGSVVVAAYWAPGDIRRYGALTTAPNNYTAIQAAINQALHPTGAKVRIPTGVWDFQTGLVINNNTNSITIEGDSTDYAVLRKVGNIVGLTVNSHANLNGFSLSSAGGADVSRGLVVDSTQRLSLLQMRIQGHGSHGIDLVQINCGTFVDVSLAANLGDGLRLTGSGAIQANACVFINMNIQQNGGWGVKLMTAMNNMGTGITCQGNVAGGVEFGQCFGNNFSGVYLESNTGPDLSFTVACVAPNYGGNLVVLTFAEDAPAFAGTSGNTNTVQVLKPGPSFQAIWNKLRADEFILANQRTDGAQPGGVLTANHPGDSLYDFTHAGFDSEVTIRWLHANAAFGVRHDMDRLVLKRAATGSGAGQLMLGSSHAGTVGAAGGATALPATPLGYLIAYLDGTQVKFPYYNA